MKFRLTSLIVLILLVLSACSLAEDITPPPGYLPATSAPSLAADLQTPAPTPTPAPSTPTVEQLTATEPSGITPTNTSATQVAMIGEITGTVVNGSGSVIPNGQKVTLEGFDADQSGNYQKTVDIEAPVNPDGSYGFSNVELSSNRAFLVITSWQGVEYPSDPIFITDATTSYAIPITIYDKTDDLSNLRFDQIHLSFDLTSQNVIQTTELFIVSNTGQEAVFVSSDGTTIPFLKLPITAGSVNFQLAQGSAPLMNATGGFALPPGSDKQYAFIASFNMAYGNSLDFEQPFTLPVSSLTAFVPQGMHLKSDQFTAAGSQALQDKTFLMYQANNLASGSSVSLIISGNPAGSTGTSDNKQTMLLIGIGIVGILLIGVGIYLYLRDRARLKNESSEEVKTTNEANSLGEDKNIIIDAMIALDDQYKSGEIGKDAYEKRRLELKNRLKVAL